MTEMVRVGLLGASNIAYKVWAAIERAGGLQVTVVGSRSAEKSQSFIDDNVSKLNISPDRAPKAATYEEVVASPDVDVVYISIPVTARDEWVRQCVEHNKHVVGEKPPAKSAAELQSWLEMLMAKDLLYMDGTMFSHGPYLSKVMEALPRVGQMRQLTSTLTFLASPEFAEKDIRFNPALEPLGALGDCGWYCVRAFLHLTNFAMPTAVAGRIVEKSASGAIVSFKGDLTFTIPGCEEEVQATFYCSFMSERECTVVVSGSKATLETPFLMNPQEREDGAAFTVVEGFMGPEGTELKVHRPVNTIAVPEENGNCQETEMWKDVRDCLKKDEVSGRLVVGKDDAHKWGKMAWMTQCILEKLVESANSAPAV